MIDRDRIEKRIVRLSALGVSLGRDIVEWASAQDPLLYLERKALLAALHEALSGVEGARVALARALMRTRDAVRGAA